MACPCTFEPVIQVDCVLELIKAVRSGNLLEEKAEILQHIGCTVGSLGKYLDTNDDDDSESIFTHTSTPAPEPATIEECCDQLETQMQLTQGVHGERKISPETWALIFKLVEMILLKFL